MLEVHDAGGSRDIVQTGHTKIQLAQMFQKPKHDQRLVRGHFVALPPALDFHHDAGRQSKTKNGDYQQKGE